MRCRSCGYEMPEGSKFCENCGAKVEAEPVGPVTAESPETEQTEPSAKKPKVKYVYKLPDKRSAKAKEESGKRSLKPLFIAAAIVVIAALLLIIKPWKGGKASEATVEKAYNAYYTVIMDKKDQIDGYTWQRDYSDSEYKEISRPVLFRDICGNEIPELILVRKDTEAEKNAAILEIYTFEKGEAKLLLSQPWDKDPGLGLPVPGRRRQDA